MLLYLPRWCLAVILIHTGNLHGRRYGSNR